LRQKIYSGTNAHVNIGPILKELNVSKFLLVHDSAFSFLHIKGYFPETGVPYAIFDRFQSNPLYEEVHDGVEVFRREKCDSIVVAGGGSAIDVAKCIKLFCKSDPAVNYLDQEFHDTGIPLIAVPTTAGTGSESTRYAVIYYDDVKQSITHESIIPGHVILEHSLLRTLPLYQKKCTMLDALCQGIEAWWSLNSTPESIGYSKAAVGKLITCYEDYIFSDHNDDTAKEIMLAANAAGQAINITQTTAAHAMSYKLTSLYGLPHGHAVALCLPYVWEYMIQNTDKCSDPRGPDHLNRVFSDISNTFGTDDPVKAVRLFRDMLVKLNIRYPQTRNREDLIILTRSVNPVRLKNNPVALDDVSIERLYISIISTGE